MILSRASFKQTKFTASQIEIAKTPLASFESNVSGLYFPEILAYIQATQSGTGTPSPNNPRPINGVSSVDTTRTGKNLSTAPLVYATAHSSTQVTEDGKSCTRFTCSVTTTYTGVRFKPNTQYTVKFNAKTVKSGTPTVNSGAFVFYYSDNTYSAIYVGKEDTTWTNYTLTSTSGKTVIGVGTLATDWRLLVYVDNDTFQLEESNTATAYEPYTGTTVTTALGDTYYGGYLNVTTGVMMFDRKLLKLDGSQTVTVGSSGYIKSDACDGYITDNDIYPKQSAWSQLSLMCSNLKQVNNSIWSHVGYPNTFAVNMAQIHVNFANDLIGVTDYTTETTSSVATKIKDYLTNNNIYVLLPIEPLTYQLTPAQIEQLLGQNNVFATGDVAVKYWKID